MTTTVMQEKVFEKGEMAEGYPWKIVYNYKTRDCSALCKHCHPQEEKVIKRSDGGTYVSKSGTIPSAVVAYNEGQCNSTAVCLDCILENA